MAIFETQFFSTALKRRVPLLVCLPIETPPNMPSKDLSKPFKTLYLLHGYSEGHTCWLNSSFIERYSMQHNIAVVMPEGENSFYLDDFAREAHYGEYIGEELVKFTRKVFNLSHKKEDTAIGGLSMGGYGAIRNGIKYAETFGAIMAFSSALIENEISKMKQGDNNGIASYDYFVHTFGNLDTIIGSDVHCSSLAKKLVDKQIELPKLYLACGTEDFLIQNNRDFSKELNNMGYQHTYIESPGVHDWVFWNEYIEKALNWYSSLQ